MTLLLPYRFGNVTYHLSSRTHIMGVLNVTPDSFFDGGKFNSTDCAVDHARRMIDAGADFIDVGGESTRPGSVAVDEEEEIRRVVPVVERIARIGAIPISVDTNKSGVARRALESGATLVNDISGMTFDPMMGGVVASFNATIVLMHIQGEPRTMQKAPTYAHVTREVTEFLKHRITEARKGGIGQIIVDPGIGFGKTLEHNVQLIRELRDIAALGVPVMIGPSRKSFIGAILDLPVDQRLEGTAAAVAVAVMNGAHIVRVHDVMEMKRVVRVVDALK